MSSASSIEDRARAVKFAKDLVKDHHQEIRPVDAATCEAVVVAALLFQKPMPELYFGFSALGRHISIIIKGFDEQSIFNTVAWVTTFMGEDRDRALQTVDHTYMQYLDGSFAQVVEVRKIEWNQKNSNAVEEAPAVVDDVPAFRRKKRT
jgi:hypothetical protein